MAKPLRTSKSIHVDMAETPKRYVVSEGVRESISDTLVREKLRFLKLYGYEIIIDNILNKKDFSTQFVISIYFIQFKLWVLYCKISITNVINTRDDFF